MAYRIAGLNPELFAPLFDAPEHELHRAGVERIVVAEKPGAPCRITLEDAEIGETVLLLSYQHQPASTPYRQAGPIFVREKAGAPYAGEGAVPPALAVRLLSLRAYDARGAMIDADVVEGAVLKQTAERLFANPAVQEVHAHYAKRGCFAARLTRL